MTTPGTRTAIPVRHRAADPHVHSRPRRWERRPPPVRRASTTLTATAAADLAYALDDFTDKAAATGAERDVWLTVGGPHDLEQRTVQLPADVADWITELLRAEPADLTGHAGSGDDGVGNAAWWG